MACSSDLNAVLQPFVSGVLEIQSEDSGLFRGTIRSITVTEGENSAVIVLFSEMKIHNGKDWVETENAPYVVSCILFSGNEISGGRYFYRIAFSNEVGTFFPPGYDK